MVDYLKDTYKAEDPSITSDYGDLVAKLKMQRDDSLLGKTFNEMCNEEESWYPNTVIHVYDPNA